MKKFFSVIVDIMVSLMAVIMLALVAPLPFGVKPKVVRSPSMSPALQVGCLVYVVPTSFSDIEVGDIITFELNSNSDPITHRVVEILKDTQQFIVKGDANEANDPNPVLYGNVQGTVKVYIPFLGYALIWLIPLHGKIIGATICVSLIILFFLLGGDKKEKNKKEQKANEKKELPIKTENIQPIEEMKEISPIDSINAAPENEAGSVPRWPLPQVRIQSENEAQRKGRKK